MISLFALGKKNLVRVEASPNLGAAAYATGEFGRASVFSVLISPSPLNVFLL